MEFFGVVVITLYDVEATASTHIEKSMYVTVCQIVTWFVFVPRHGDATAEFHSNGIIVHACQAPWCTVLDYVSTTDDGLYRLYSPPTMCIARVYKCTPTCIHNNIA
jgi:hypothetical protein